MDRATASKLCKDLLTQYGLPKWHVVLNMDSNVPFVGKCDHGTQTIILSAIAVDIHPDCEVEDTIRHEIAHALVGPYKGHGKEWQDKAIELGATPTSCSSMDLPPHVLDAIRSGHNVEVEVTEKTHVVKTAAYKVTRLQEKCPHCGKVAVERFSVQTVDNQGN